MIIQNGTIEAKTKQAGGIDPTTGFPIKSAGATYSPAIPCQYIPNKNNLLGRTQGGESFTVASYIILIEQQEKPFYAEQIRLKDLDGKEIGEYSIIATENMEAVCEVKIIV